MYSSHHWNGRGRLANSSSPERGLNLSYILESRPESSARRTEKESEEDSESSEAVSRDQFFSAVFTWAWNSPRKSDKCPENLNFEFHVRYILFKMGAHFLVTLLNSRKKKYCFQSRTDASENEKLSENVKRDGVIFSGIESSPPLHTIALANRIRNRQQSHDVTTQESGDGHANQTGIRQGSPIEQDKPRIQPKSGSVKHFRSQRYPCNFEFCNASENRPLRIMTQIAFTYQFSPNQGRYVLKP